MDVDKTHPGLKGSTILEKMWKEADEAYEALRQAHKLKAPLKTAQARCDTYARCLMLLSFPKTVEQIKLEMKMRGKK